MSEEQFCPMGRGALPAPRRAVPPAVAPNADVLAASLRRWKIAFVVAVVVAAVAILCVAVGHEVARPVGKPAAGGFSFVPQ